MAEYTEAERYRMEQAHAWLYGVALMREHVEECRARVTEARQRAEGTGNVRVRRVGGKGGHADPTANAMPRVLDAREKLLSAFSEYAEASDEARKAVLSMPDVGEQVELLNRYLVGDPAKARRMSAGKALRRALLHAYDVMPHRYRDPLHRAL